jgi:hypothetical protein
MTLTTGMGVAVMSAEQSRAAEVEQENQAKMMQLGESRPAAAHKII